MTALVTLDGFVGARRIILLCALTFNSVPLVAQHVLPLSVDDAIETRHFLRESPIDLSPDGEWVAYTVKQSLPTQQVLTNFSRTGISFKIGEGGEVWLTNTKSLETLKLTQHSGSSWSPVWSPDGLYLAFFSDRDGYARVWTWSRKNREIRRVSDLIVRPNWAYQVPRWSPAGRSILVKALNPSSPIDGEFRKFKDDGIAGDSTESASGPTVRVFEFPGAPETNLSDLGSARVTNFDRTDPEFADLALVEVDSGEVRRIVNNVFPANYWFSPCGDYVAYLSRARHDQGNVYNLHFDVVVVRLADGKSLPIVTDVTSRGFMAAAWSPDSTHISLADRGGNIFIGSLRGDPVRKISVDANSGWVSAYRAPLWDIKSKFVYVAAGSTLWKIDPATAMKSQVTQIHDENIVDIVSVADGRMFWSPNNSLVVVTRDKASQSMAYHEINLSNGKSSLLLREDKLLADRHSGITSSLDTSDDGQRIVFVAEGAQHPQDLWIAERRFHRPKRLTDLNPQLGKYVFGKIRMIDWYSLDGRRLQGAVLLPSDYEMGKKYPLIVHLYGDALLSQVANRFGGLPGSTAFNLQIFATRGYAVLYPDAPLKFGTPMLDLLQTVLPGVNKAVELGIADPDRLGVMGQSFGGYSTLSLLVQTQRFKAAVVEAGYANVLATYGYMGRNGEEHFFLGWNEKQAGKIGGTPWEYRERYIENSPVFYLDRVTTPVLLIHGTADDGVRVAQAEEIFVGLRRLGKIVTIAEYDGEGHRLSRRPNIKDAWDRIMSWFEKYLMAQTLKSGSGSRDTFLAAS
ncbi:MAG TPA: prolyl oligopeptidase family serine peptidase [Pyrinomonadaceae bacterium]|nr:prolyl oligopeptidase family serine peptidase [Pyrinomonadaceae bacterium]